MKTYHFSFELTMPVRKSASGQWAGDLLYVSSKGTAKHYVIHEAKGVSAAMPYRELLKGENLQSYYYTFADGWVAQVTVEEVTNQQANKRKRNSKGFCGLSWLVSSLVTYGYIKGLREAVELHSLFYLPQYKETKAFQL